MRAPAAETNQEMGWGEVSVSLVMLNVLPNLLWGSALPVHLKKVMGPFQAARKDLAVAQRGPQCRFTRVIRKAISFYV